MSTAVIAVVVTAVGVVLTAFWNLPRYLADRRNQLAGERLDAYAGLLAALHKLNNAHQLDTGATEPSRAELQAGRDARDEVWAYQARIQLLGPRVVREAADALVEEYHSSSLDRGGKRRAIDRAGRKRLREEFEGLARQKLPGAE